MVRKSNNCCLSIVIFVFPALVIYFNVSSGPGSNSVSGDRRYRHSSRSHGNQLQVAQESINWTVENERLSARMSGRLRTLKENCEKFGLTSLAVNDSLHRPNPWEFLINKKYGLVWCNVFKAASSSWLYNFNILAGYSPQYLRRQSQSPVLSLARVKYPRPSLSDLESAVSAPSSLTFVIVRHPFERLLSAYRDKIYNSLPNTIHRTLSSAIVRRYRPQAVTKSNSRRASFEEFVLYLLDTFRTNESALDMHWAPVVQFCTPCLVNFNMILKFETLQEDQRYLIELAGLSLLIKPEWFNEGKGGATSEMIGKFYSELSADQLYQLYNVYKYDFELFDYTMEEYLEYVRYP